MKINTHDVRVISARVRGGKPYCVKSILQWCASEGIDILELHNGIDVEKLLNSKDGRAVQVAELFIKESEAL